MTEEKKYLTEKQIEEQEHLTKVRLANLLPKHINLSGCEPRPEKNLIDLMHWVKNNFSNYLGDVKDLNPWIHNKVVIDGSFLQFSEEVGAKIECLYRDSIASWRSDEKYEHFMMQGIFKITKGDLSFIHAALFHKGNQNEDEVSFFVIVSDSKYEEYIDFRNQFDDWLTKRDREHLEIHVVNGEGFPYERNMSWDDVFLPEDLKQNIRSTVEGFLASKDLYEKKKIPWKRGILLYGEPGCGKTTTIRSIISNYDFKPVTVQPSSLTNDETITEAFSYAQEQSPGLLYIEDLDTLLNSTVSVSHFLNLLDGVSSNNGVLVIATANDLSRLNEAVIDRPSRFDRKILVPLPNKDMTIKYLKFWFADSLDDSKYEEIAKQTVDMKFSYAYLKELYLGSAYHAVIAKKQDPDIDDINKTLEQLIQDKDSVLDGFDTGSNEGIGID